MALGSLVVRLGLDAAEFISGLTQAENQAKKFTASVEKSSQAQKDALANANALGRGIGLAMAAAATAAIGAVVAVDQLIKSVGRFKDIEERIGGSAEGFASLAVSATVGGASMEDVARTSVLLTRNLDNVKGTARSTAAGLAALNIPLKEFQTLDPVARYERLGKALNQFADGSGKTAALEAIARGASSLLPFLKELNAQGGRQVVITQEQIELADKYADTQARLGAQIKQQLQKAAIEAAPAMLALTQTVQDLITGVTGLAGASTDLARNRGIHDFAVDAGKALASLATLAQSTKGILEILLDTSKAFGSAAIAVAKQDFGEAAALAEASLKRSSATIKGQVTPSQLFEKNLQQNAIALLREQENAFRSKTSKKPDVPKIADFAGSRSAGRVAISEAQRYLESLQKQLQKTDELSAAETVLADIRSGRLKLSGGITQERLVGIAQQIDEAKALKKSLEEEVKAREANSRATLKAQEAAIQDVERMVEQNVALRDEIALIDADVAARKAVEQARISSAIALKEDTVAMLQNAGASPAVIAALEQQINLLRERGVLLGQRSAIDQGIEDANKAQRAYALTLDRVGLAQRRIDIAQESGAITSLEALRQRSDATKSYIGTLQKQLAVTEALARLEINPIKREDALHRVEQMRVELEALAAQGDLVAKKFNDIFAGSFANSLSDFIDGTKSAKEAFKDFAKSVTQQINQIASQNIAESLFGKGGIGAGIGDIFSGLFGGPSKAATKGGDPAAAAASVLAATTATSTTAIASLGTATAATTLTFPVLDLGLGSLALAAKTAAAALLAVASSKGAGAMGDLFSEFAGSALGGMAQGGGFAMGGDPPVGKWSLVGEKGPELFMPKVAGTIIPNHKLKSGVLDRLENPHVNAGRKYSAFRLSPDLIGGKPLAQRRIDIADESGTTLQSLRQRSNATKAYIGVLQKQLATVEALARTEIDPLKRGDTLSRAEQLNEQIEALLAALANIKSGGSSELFSVGGFSSGKVGHFAAGGVPPVGRPSWVGERGPELFVPKMAGTIISNHALKTIGGDTVNIVNNIITAPAGPSSAKDASKDFAKSVTQQIASQNIAESLFRKDDARGFFSNLFNSQSKATTSALATVATTSAAKDIAFTGFIGLTAAAETAAAALLSMRPSKTVAAFTQPAAVASRLIADFDRTQQSATTLTKDATSAVTETAAAALLKVSEPAASALAATRVMATTASAVRTSSAHARTDTQALAASMASNTVASNDRPVGRRFTAKQQAIKDMLAPILADLPQAIPSAAIANAITLLTGADDPLASVSRPGKFDQINLGNQSAQNTLIGYARPKDSPVQQRDDEYASSYPQFRDQIRSNVVFRGYFDQTTHASIPTIVGIDTAVADAKLINRREQTLREFVPILQPSVSLPQVLQADAVELGLGLLALAAEKTATALLSINASKRLASARPGADLSPARLSRQPLSALPDFTDRWDSHRNRHFIASVRDPLLRPKTTPYELARDIQPDTWRQNVDRLPFEYVKQRPAEVEQVRIAFRRDVGDAKIAYGRHVAQAMMQPPPQPASWPQADRALISLGRYTPPRAVAHVPGLPRASVWRSPGVLPGLDTLSRAKPLVADAALLGLRKMASSTTAALTTVTTISAPLSVGFITLTTAAETAAAALLSIRVGKEASVFNVLRGRATGSFSDLVEGRGYAMGGNPPIGRASWVGERGPELFVPKVSGTIVPNNQIRTGGDTISNAFYFNLPPHTTSQSASQMALEVGRRVSQVMRRKN